MADNQFGRSADGVSRRKFIVATGAIGTMAAAGCLGSAGEDDSIKPLTADGSSTVYPITNDADSLWNGNPPADDEEYWGPGQYDIDTDENLADYWAGLYGFEPTGERSVPPFSTQVALSHSGTGVEGVINERVDIGDASSTAESILGSDREELDNIVDHVVAVDGQPIVVSRESTKQASRRSPATNSAQSTNREITNWSEVGGPDKEIYAIGRAEDSGTDTAFRANLYGDPEEPIEPTPGKGRTSRSRPSSSKMTTRSPTSRSRSLNRTARPRRSASSWMAPSTSTARTSVRRSIRSAATFTATPTRIPTIARAPSST